MAYIYSKNTGDCLILGTQEGLIYPFSFTPFQEIRMGGFFSIVSGGTFNSGFLAIGQNINNPKNTFYIGLKDSGNILPETSGSCFVGMSRRGGDTTINITSSFLCFGGDTSHGYGNFTISDTLGNTISYEDTNQQGIKITNPAPDTNFASFWGISIGIKGNLFSGMVLYDTNFYTDVTTGNLSHLINNPPLVTGPETGYYTTGNLDTNNLLPIPNSIFIYFPFANNNLRIHSLDIEKFN